MRKYVILNVVLIMIFVAGCSNTIDNEAKEMLANYNLHPDSKFKQEEIIFRDHPPVKSGSQGVINLASKDIGLDLTNIEGEKVKVLSCLLKERSQGSTGKVFAHFLEKDNKLVGAFLSLEGYAPGVVSLRDRSFFAPENLTPNNLEFNGVNKISMNGPSGKEFEDEVWKNQVVIQELSEIDGLTSLLSSSTRKKGNRSGTLEDESYLIILHYIDGPEVRVRLTTFVSSSESVVTFDLEEFYKWHYIPNKELVDYIRTALK